MIIDAHDLPDHLPLFADICIVGAGAAGIALALQFERKGQQVLLLEAGGLSHEQAAQALYAGEVSDSLLHPPLDSYRERRFGGSTTIWGGRCVPFDAIDFEARPWIPHSGWPIDRAALLPYYAQANAACETGAFSYSVAEAFDRAPRALIQGFNSPHFDADALERFSCPTDFGKRYSARLRAAPNICVVLHANVTHLQLNPAGTRVSCATIRTLKGTALNVHAGTYALAAGGLEVTRLLLASRDVHGNGIGNDHDVVGRYYMCHLAGTIGTLSFTRPDAVWHGYDISAEGVYCRRRLALTADCQRRRQLSNFVARLHHPRITDPSHRTGLLSMLYLARAFIPFEYGKRLYGDEGLNARSIMLHLRNVVCDPFGTAAFLLHWLRYRTLAERKYPSVIIRSRACRFSLDFHAEQLPNANSRVRLGDAQDALGMPRLSVDWRYSPADVDSVKRSLELLSSDLRESGAGRFDYDPATVEQEMIRYGAYGGHHIGTTRMGNDRRSSVVDANCRVHGVDNLFIASASVFPTSSQANPTLTVIALALRLADHLNAFTARERVPPVVAVPKIARMVAG